MISEFLQGILEVLAYFGASFVLVVVGKVAYQLFHPGINVKHELVEKDNFSFSLAHTGYLVGLLLSIASVMMGESNGLQSDLLDIGFYGLLGILLLNVAVLVNDKLILSKFDIKKEIIVDQNVGSGAVEAGSAVATGLVILGSIYGEGGSVLTVLIYFAIGQLILVLTSFVYNWITPYDIHEHIERDNIAVGIGFAGALVAIGNLVRNALVHTFVDWETNILWLVLEVLLGLMLLPLARWMADKILLPGQNLNDEIVNQEKPNVGAGLIEAFAYVGGSMLICWAL